MFTVEGEKVALDLYAYVRVLCFPKIKALPENKAEPNYFPVS